MIPSVQYFVEQPSKEIGKEEDTFPCVAQQHTGTSLNSKDARLANHWASEAHPGSRPSSPSRIVYRPDNSYQSPPAAIATPRGGHMGDEGQLLYQIGESPAMHGAREHIIRTCAGHVQPHAVKQ